MNRSYKAYYDWLILAILLLTGGILRFYDFSNIPMTHDELSAFYRLQFDTFHELIEKGVKGDGHPAGIQVFLYYWTKLFGFSDMAFKLPFLLFGLGAIPLSYLIAKKWFNAFTGLLVATCISSLQFPVMYSQIARPYISGLFFCLLMVLFWTQLLFENKGRKILNGLGFILSAVACSYNHHFSLLFAFIVGVTGLFFLKKETKWPYILSLILISALYIPHLNIFFAQLNTKGLVWLGKPANTFILDHISYLFHHHPLTYISVLIIPLTGLLVNRHEIRFSNKFRLIALIWFLAPILTGFFYSAYVKPVIQHSMLIFSFPFLLIFLFSFQKVARPGIMTGTIMLVLLLNTSTLIWSRQHYDIFYKQPFKEYATLTNQFFKEQNKEKQDVTIVFNDNPKYIDHYFKKYNPGLSYISTFNPGISLTDFRKKIASAHTSYLISGNLPLQYLCIVREYYPDLIFKDYGFTYEYHIFSKGKHVPSGSVINDKIFQEVIDFDHKRLPWKDIETHLVQDTSKGFVYAMDTSMEWSPAYQIALTDMVQSRYDFIDIGIDYKCTGNNHTQVICIVEKNGRQIKWNATTVHDFYDPAREDQWQKAYLSFRLTNVFSDTKKMKGAVLKVLFWNIKKENILIDHIEINARKGNPLVYALFEKVEHPDR